MSSGAAKKGSLAAKVAAGHRLEGLAGEGSRFRSGESTQPRWGSSNELTKATPLHTRYWLASVGSEGCAGTSMSILPWSSRNGG